jgi:hypothetical protein
MVLGSQRGWLDVALHPVALHPWVDANVVFDSLSRHTLRRIAQGLTLEVWGLPGLIPVVLLVAPSVVDVVCHWVG